MSELKTFFTEIAEQIASGDFEVASKTLEEFQDYSTGDLVNCIGAVRFCWPVKERLLSWGDCVKTLSARDDTDERMLMGLVEE